MNDAERGLPIKCGGRKLALERDDVFLVVSEFCCFSRLYKKGTFFWRA